MHAIESKAQPLPPEPTMRQERTVQATIFEVFAGHEIGCELKTISRWLDRQSTLASLVAGDLRRHGVRETGRRGLPAETVLRCALLKRLGCYFYTAVLPLVVLSRVADRLKWHGHEGGVARCGSSALCQTLCSGLSAARSCQYFGQIAWQGSRS
jgi:IS5 family transposase